MLQKSTVSSREMQHVKNARAQQTEIRQTKKQADAVCSKRLFFVLRRRGGCCNRDRKVVCTTGKCYVRPEKQRAAGKCHVRPEDYVRNRKVPCATGKSRARPESRVRGRKNSAQPERAARQEVKIFFVSGKNGFRCRFLTGGYFRGASESKYRQESTQSRPATTPAAAGRPERSGRRPTY